MEKQRENEHESHLRLTRWICERTGRQMRLVDHLHCPYNLGSLEDLEEGRHERFCDYHEGVDPVNFGFRPGITRYRSG